MKKFLTSLFLFTSTALLLGLVFTVPLTHAQQNIERTSTETSQNPTTTTPPPSINGPTASNQDQETIQNNAAADTAASGGSGSIVNWLTNGAVSGLLGLLGRFFAIIIWIFSWFLFWAGLFFDTAINFSITSGAFRTENVALLNIGWPVVRDFSSLFIVFSMIVISIATILRIESYAYKTALPRLILVALLISFSLPVGQFIIDASNVLAVGIYNNITDAVRNDPGVTAATNIFGVSVGNAAAISEVFAQGLSITQVHMVQNDSGLGALSAGFNGSVSMIVSMIMGIIVLLVTSFIFVAFGMLFVLRTVVLWILLVFSPLAFAGMIFPMTSKYSSDWWAMLFKQSFFAPISLFMIWLVAQFINNGIVQSTIDHSVSVSTTGFYNGFASNMQLVMQYVILIVLLWKSLELAQQFGAHGAEALIKKGIEWRGVAKDATKRYGQDLTGRVLDKTLDNQGATGRVARSLIGNRVSSTLGITRGVLSASTRGKEAREYTAKKEAELLKGLSSREQARMLRSMSGAGALQSFNGMSDDDKTKVTEHLNDVNNPATLQNFASTLRTAAEKDKSGNIKPDKVMESMARAALPHVADATEALRIMNPTLFAAGAPAFAPGTPEHDQTSSAIAKLMNGMKSDQRADVFQKNGNTPGDMGKFMREYFAQNGTLNDINKNQASMTAGNGMLQRLVVDNNIDLARATAEANRAAGRRAERARGIGAPPTAAEREDAMRKAIADQFDELHLDNLAMELRRTMGAVLMSPTGARVRNPS